MERGGSGVLMRRGFCRPVERSDREGDWNAFGYWMRREAVTREG